MKKVILFLAMTSVSMASYAQKPVPKAPPPPPPVEIPPPAVEPPPPPALPRIKEGAWSMDHSVPPPPPPPPKYVRKRKG